MNFAPTAPVAPSSFSEWFHTSAPLMLYVSHSPTTRRRGEGGFSGTRWSSSSSTRHVHRHTAEPSPSNKTSQVRSIVGLLLSGALFLVFLEMESAEKKVDYVETMTVPSMRRKKQQPSQNGDDVFFPNLRASLNPQQRCYDQEDPPAWKAQATAALCQCTDPTVPVAGDRKRWTDFHQALVARAAATPPQLDVLFFGDSITERWIGTKSSGKTPAPDFQQVFRQSFSRAAGANLEGAAFGGSGDTSVELLYHLQHGVLPDHVQPRAIFLLIGTNDLGRVKCSKTYCLAGILHAARYLQQKRPQAILILHGLLPRNEEYGDGNFTLGMKWEQIQWINRRLQMYCAKQHNWHYIENPVMFLSNETTINATLMDDALHPSLLGYRMWTPRLAAKIQELLDVGK